MKAVLISINPQWCDLILSRKKTIEIRKTFPNLNLPFKVYIYMTKYKNISPENGGGKIIGEFTCDDIYPIRVFENGSIQDYMCHGLERSCVPYDDIANYIGYNKAGYGWHISDLVIYDSPKDLSNFYRYGYLNAELNSIWDVDDELWKVIRPPQSYMFVEDSDEVYRLIKQENTETSEQSSLVSEYLSIDDPAEQLNYFRNLHYKDPGESETLIVARALDKILPELARLRKEKEYGK